MCLCSWLSLALVSLCEHRFFDTLPTSIDIACLWPEDDVAWLKGSYLIDLCKGMRASFRKEYDALQECLLSPHKDFTCDSSQKLF